MTLWWCCENWRNHFKWSNMAFLLVVFWKLTEFVCNQWAYGQQRQLMMTPRITSTRCNMCDVCVGTMGLNNKLTLCCWSVTQCTDTSFLPFCNCPILERIRCASMWVSEWERTMDTARQWTNATNGRNSTLFVFVCSFELFRCSNRVRW